MIELSVVTGTYNRIKYLQQMVESVRSSLGGRVPYEIIIVDGGSKDGTQKWCKQQEDIRLIEHGSLQGAVKAFNDGATAAVGRYVVLANDDVYFNDKSLVRAISFMELNPTVGIGCLFQDRGGREWHVEQMPAILNGKQVSVPYGQVCIVRKWLGDKVGWWGNITRTYGGDNELSCNVLELGYKVEPIKCACISDLRVEDELRLLNGGTPAEKIRNHQPHPDTTAWTKKWTHPDGKVGPIIAPTPKDLHVDAKRHLILYAPIYEPGNDLQRQTKVGLLEALQQDNNLVYEYDYTADGLDGLFDIAEDFQPTLFLLQIQDTRTFTPDIIRALKAQHQGAKFVSWNGDYHPEHLNDVNYVRMMKLFDLATFVTADIEQAYRRAGIKYMYWQIGYETPRIVSKHRIQKHDVVFLGNAYSRSRIALGSFLASLRKKKYDVGLYGKWDPKIKTGENLYDFDSGELLYNRAKLAVSDQQWPRAKGYVSNRIFQAMAAGGCMVLQQKFDGMEDYLGIKDGVHLRTWETHDELEELIVHYMKHKDEREKISKTGQAYVLKNHSFEVRVRELMSAIS